MRRGGGRRTLVHGDEEIVPLKKRQGAEKAGMDLRWKGENFLVPRRTEGLEGTTC